MKKNQYLTVLLAIAIQISVYQQINAQTIVRTKSELTAALENVTAGSEIILSNGTWTDVAVSAEVEATADNPVIIRAETIGSVFFEGNSQVEIGGSFITFQGVVFQNPSGLQVSSDRIDPIISFRANGTECNDCVVTNIKIDSYNGESSQEEAIFKWILVYGFRNEISYSSFLGKNGVGSIINHNRNNGEADHTKIHHNYFADRTPVGEFNNLNDQDCIRIGNSSTSLSDSFTEVYENYFNDFSGEIEIISNKSGSNKYYNNTFRNYQGSLTLRHGNDCEVYGNFFFANNNSTTAGIRVIGERHKIYNNYIEGVNSRKEGGSLSGATGGINISNGRPNTELNGYFTVIDVEIVHNTFVNCDYAIRFGTDVSSSLTLAPQNVDISNNIMLNSSSSAFLIQTSESNSMSARGNITENGDWDLTTNVNDNIESSSGLLSEGEEFYRIANGSSAINAGVGNYSFLENDILDGTRTSQPDAGAEEFGAAGERLPYTNDDVGVKIGFGANVPDFPGGGDIVLNVNDETSVENEIILYPNPVSGNFINLKSALPIQGEVFINDISGKTILKKQLSHQSQPIDLSGLKPGIYMLVIPGRSSQRFMVIDK